MTEPSPAFRCSVASQLRDEDIAGTASTVRAFLLIENPGPWGVNALRDARLPDGLGVAVSRAAAAAKVRPLLIRRVDRRTDPAGIRVFAAFAHPTRSWAETTVLIEPHELLDIDLVALGSGRSPGLTPYDAPLLCVCTHGKHDTCCAECGRPVAAALDETHPDHTWETSHIGGDRFAANMVVLPDGLYYGRLDPTSAPAVARSHLTGALDLEHLRGRSSYAMPVQFAEIALRRHLGETRAGALELVSRRSVDGITDVVFEVCDDQWAVQVRTELDADPHRLTCHSTHEEPAPVHQVLSTTRLSR